MFLCAHRSILLHTCGRTRTQTRFSGHSKWSKIRHAKGANDIQKSKQTSRVVRKIEAGIRAMNGIIDPEFNHYLAAALHAAKAAQIPKSKITEAINRASNSKLDGGLEAKIVRYEGVGPAGIAVIVEALVSNPAKTAAEMKLIFKQFSSSFGSSVEYLFERKGFVTISTETLRNSLEQLMNDAIELEAEDVGEEDLDSKSVQVYASYEKVSGLQEALMNKGYDVQGWGHGHIPIERVDLDESALEKFVNFLDKIKDQDEVVDVYHNAK